MFFLLKKNGENIFRKEKNAKRIFHYERSTVFVESYFFHVVFDFDSLSFNYHTPFVLGFHWFTIKLFIRFSLLRLFHSTIRKIELIFFDRFD